MKVIREKIITSDFGEKESEIFVYVSEKQTNKILFILKGMYGRHVPFSNVTSKQKWDMQFVNRFTKDIHVVCCNTSSGPLEEGGDSSTRRKAFDGKTFQQEIHDIQRIIQRVKEIYITLGVEKPEFYFFGKSFGGTLLLGLQDILESNAIFMVGSGCGKSDTTTKTLLATMPSEDILLKNISKYKKGTLYFFRGELDDVVPKVSQEKIVNAVNKNRVDYRVLEGVDHEFEKVNGIHSDFPAEYLMQKISNTII